MELPLQITFRGMTSSPALERRIREKAQKLQKLHDRIASCRVIVEARARQRDGGRIFRVRVALTGPRYEICVGKSNRDAPAHADVYAAVHDSFDAAARQVQDQVRISRGNIKAHLGR